MPSKIDLFWLGGYLQAEGSFVYSPSSSGPTISVQTTDKDVGEEAASLMNATFYKIESRVSNHKDVYHIKKKGAIAAWLMSHIKEVVSNRKKDSITEIIEEYENPRGLTPIQVAEIYKRTTRDDEKHAKIAKDYPVGRRTVSHISDKDFYKEYIDLSDLILSDSLASPSKNEEALKNAWTAGLLEGDGWIGSSDVPQVRLTSKDEEIIDELQRLWGGRKYSKNPRKERWSKMWEWVLFRNDGLKGLIKRILPHLGNRRTEQALSLDI